MNGLKYDNTFVLTVRSGETGEILCKQEGHNDISDDFLCGRGHIFTNHYLANAFPWCFLLPDGSAWAGFVWDRTNPWAPYCTTANNLGDINADALYKSKIDTGCSLTVPFDTGNPVNKWKLFYRWSNLPIDLQLKAFGLTGWQDNPPNFIFGMPAQSGDPSGTPKQTTFLPQTLVTLPAAILVRGRNVSVPNAVAAQTPDILEITYYLSIVGA
jgi:hypothetical protein